MNKNNIFPESAGAYIAQRGTDVIMFRIKGMYPTLEMDSVAIDLTKFLEKGKIEPCGKELVENVHLFPEKWNISALPNIDMSVFPITAYCPIARRDLSVDEYYQIKSKYERFCQMGISYVKSAKAISFEFKIPVEEVLETINKIDDANS